MKRIALIVALGALVASCSGTDGQANDSSSRIEPGAEATLTSGAAGDATEELAAFLSEFSRLSASWNENQARWIASLTDPSVSYEDFLVDSTDLQSNQARVVAEMSFLSSRVTSAELQRETRRLVDHYGDRLRALQDVIATVVAGNPSDMDQALLDYQAVAVRSREVLESFATSDVVQRAFPGDTSDLIAAFDAIAPEQLPPLTTLPPASEFSADIVAGYMEGCTSEQSEAFCQCTLDEIQQRFSEAEFIAFAIEARDDPPPEFIEIAFACLGEADLGG